MSAQASPSDPAPAAPRKRSRCCCCCCLGLFLTLLLTVGGFVATGWWLFTPPPTPVQVQFDSLPEYFPPEAPP